MHALKRLITMVMVGILLVPPTAAAQQKPSREPPIEIDFDMNDIPEPKARKTSLAYDFFDATLVQQTKQTFDIPRFIGKKPALNVNSVDQVPDSSWFTNRNGRQPLSGEEIRRGPNTSDGPDMTTPWTIVAGKRVGSAPGFMIKDARGQRYLIKFDLPDFPELASGAEAIATKLYYASGYKTPENYIVRFDPQDLHIAPNTMIVDERGRRRPMTPNDLEELLSKVAHLPDGRIRALASKFLPGKPKGPFRSYGLRDDDPNDWIPHEQRRDLRGLRVIASWLNDTDRKELNTLDMYVSEQGRRFLRHYLIDFSSSLGTGGTAPKQDYAGFEYNVDGGEILKSVAALGFYERPWANRQKIVHPSIGYFESEIFDPGRWKTKYPVIAFEHMTVADAYWAAKIVMSFTDEQIRPAVETAEYSDPAATEYVTRVLIGRRNKIGRYWFTRAGGLDNFRVSYREAQNPVLEFDDLLVHYEFATPAEREYRYRVLRDKKKERWHEFSWPELSLDSLMRGEAPTTYVVEVQARNKRRTEWSPTVAIHLAVEKGELQILGWVRSDE